MSDIERFVVHDRERLLAELMQWCAIPSVGTDPAHAADMQRSAQWLLALMSDAGLDAQILQMPGGHPAVYGAWLGAGTDAPTVLLYGHHDVQPADVLDAWESAPFAPEIRGDHLYARGASDDKGQVHLQLAAVRHLLATDGRLPVNLKVLIEGEEEAGSTTIVAMLRAHAELLACDVILVSDTGMYAADLPSLVVSMRGLMYFELSVRTCPTDLHSGAFGGAVPNAAGVLTGLLAKLVDAKSGRIAIPGWYDDVRPMDARERRSYASLHFDTDGFMRLLGLSQLCGERGYGTLERVGSRPSVDINGIWSGYTGPGSKTIIPGRADAKLSFRLVAHQDPNRLRPLFEQWVEREVAPGAQATVHYHSGVRPADTPLDYIGNRAVARAMERAWGRPPLFAREGGSGPERSLSDELGAPCVYFGVMLPDDHIHAPNEHLHLPSYFRGICAAAYVLEELGATGMAAALRQ